MARCVVRNDLWYHLPLRNTYTIIRKSFYPNDNFPQKVITLLQIVTHFSRLFDTSFMRYYCLILRHFWPKMLNLSLLLSRV